MQAYCLKLLTLNPLDLYRTLIVMVLLLIL